MFEPFSGKYSLISKFFENYATNGKIPNSIILYGQDVPTQYCFAKLLARAANCTGTGLFDCSCKNCNFISSNTHAAISTVSKIDSKPADDATTTVISKKQTDAVKDKILHTSDYHRFFIFCDAELKTLSSAEKRHFEELRKFNVTFPSTENQTWVPKGLTPQCFSDVTANSLLKCIEEPPEKVSFVFLTQTPENLISTIISRSQIFYVPGSVEKVYDCDFFAKYFDLYPFVPNSMICEISRFLEDFKLSSGRSTSEILDNLIFGFVQKLKTAQNFAYQSKILSDIEKIKKCKELANSSVKDEHVFTETAFVFVGKI